MMGTSTDSTSTSSDGARRLRWPRIAGGAAALSAVVLILTACGSGEDEQTTATPTSSTTASSSPTPTSSSPSPSSVVPEASEMEGDWCLAGSDGSYGSCLWIELPRVVYLADSDNGLYLFPGDDLSAQPDESTNLDGEENRLPGGCLTYQVDDWPTTEQQTKLWYCPAGATVPSEGFLADEPATADTERLYLGITEEGALYERADASGSA